MNTRIQALLVDDDVRLGEMLAEYLDRHQVRLDVAHDGDAGLRRAKEREYDVVLLDVMLPGLDGMEICRRLRAESSVPILMLTARGETADRVVGLELGADDYMPKPFDSRELVARIHAVLRRARGLEPDGGILRCGPIEIDTGARTVKRDGLLCELTGFQFDLLHYLASRAGRVLSREVLLEGTRGRDLEAFDRSIDVHISRIRAAIGDDSRNPRFLVTVRGVGYMFVSDPEDAE